MTPSLLLAVVSFLPGQATPAAGAIRGTVVNASQAQVAVSGAEVALRVNVDGQFVLAAETKTDEQGRFEFDDIPADPDYVYLAGANWDTVHYPGPRIQLTNSNRLADIQLAVHDTVEAPNPLIVRDHKIVIEPEIGVLRITESMEIDNPSRTTYVGQPSKADGRAATLWLSIPSDFTRVTFHEEFFGRRFTVIDGRPVTDIPWTPGTRELTFTYVVPNDDRTRTWKRPLDLPTSDVSVHVHTDGDAAGEAVLSNLTPDSGAARSHRYVSRSLSAGHVLEVTLGELPTPFAAHAKWIALGTLVVIVLLTVVLQRLQTRARSAGDAAKL